MIGGLYFGQYTMVGGVSTAPTYVITKEDITVVIFPHDPDGDGVDPTTVMVSVDGGALQHMTAGPSLGQFKKLLHLSGVPGATVNHLVHFEAADTNIAGSLTGTLDVVVIVALPLVAPPPPPTPPGPIVLAGPAPNAVTWTLVHYDHNGNQVADYEPADLSFGTYANQPGYFNGMLHLKHPAAKRKWAEPHVHDWILYRNNVQLLGGILTGASIDSDSRMLTLAGNTWDSYFDSLVMPYDQNNPIDKHYYNQDLYTIVENIVSYILAAYPDNSLDLTLANGLSGIKIAEQHFIAAELNTLTDIIQSLGGQNPGFDYEVSWDQQLKLFTPRRGSYLDYTLSLGAGNIVGWHYELSGVRGTSDYGRGTPATATAQVVVHQEDDGASSTYRHRDVITDFSTVKSQSQLGKLTTADLQDAVKQVYSFKVTLQNPGVNIYSQVGWGDYIKLNADNQLDYDDFDQEFFRVTSLEGYVNDRGTEQVVFTLGQEH